MIFRSWYLIFKNRLKSVFFHRKLDNDCENTGINNKRYRKHEFEDDPKHKHEQERKKNTNINIKHLKSKDKCGHKQEPGQEMEQRYKPNDTK